MKLKIAFISRSNTVNAYYRSVGPMFGLAGRGHQIAQILPPDGPPNLEALDWCDVLHVHRFSQGAPFDVMRRAHAAGIPIVWDNDDDQVAPPRGRQRKTAQWSGFERQQLVGATRRVMTLASAVVTPSAELGRIFSAAGARRVCVFENYVPEEFLETERPSRSDGGLVIGWIGALEHETDARQLKMASLFRRVLAENDQISVTTLGLDLGLPAGRYRRVKPRPFAELGEWAASFDIGIAPLADIRLNRSRSNVKLKEYAAVGTPWLASPIGPYIGLGEAQGGRLVEDDAWYDALSDLIARPDDRQRLSKNGREWARSQTIGGNALQWERLFAEVVKGQRGGGGR